MTRRPRSVLSLVLLFPAFLSTVLVLGSVLLAPPAVSGQQATTAPFRAITLDPAPVWVSSGAVTRNGEALLIDPVRGSINLFSAAGRQLGRPLLASRTAAFSGERPTELQPHDGSWLVLTRNAFHPLTAAGGQVALRGAPNSAGLAAAERATAWIEGAVRPDAAVKKVFRVHVHEEGILAYADILEGSTWTSGFVWIPGQDPSSFELLYRVPLDSQMRRYNLLLTDYLLSVAGPQGNSQGEAFYFLAYEATPVLYRFQPGQGIEKVVELDAYADLPRMEDAPAPGGVYQRYKNLESARMPAGLFAFRTAEGRDALLLLTREVEAGAPLWRLHVVDADTGEIRASRKLPADGVAHLSILTGPGDWLALRRGPVDPELVQDNSQAMIVPRGWLEELASDGAAPAADLARIRHTLPAARP